MAGPGLVALQPSTLRAVRRAGGGRRRAGFAGIGLFALEYERLRDEEGRSAKDIGQQLEDHGLVLAEIETVHGWSSSGGAELRSAAGARTSPTNWPTGRAAGTSRRSVRTRARSPRPARPSARCATGPPPRAPRRHRVAAVHEHRHGRGRPSDRRRGRPAQRWVLRRHLAPPARRRRRLDAPGATRRPGSPCRWTTARDEPQLDRLQAGLPRQPRPPARASSTACSSSDSSPRSACSADLARGVLDGAVGGPGYRSGHEGRRCHARRPRPRRTSGCQARLRRRTADAVSEVARRVGRLDVLDLVPLVDHRCGGRSATRRPAVRTDRRSGRRTSPALVPGRRSGAGGHRRGSRRGRCPGR